MADVDTQYLAAQNSDIRREAVEHTNEIVREGLKEAYITRGDVKDARYDISTRMASHTSDLSKQVDAIDDTLTAQLVTISRESADNRAQITALGFQVRDGFTTAAKDAEINALKTQMEAAKNTTYLSDKIGADGDKTRALLNELKYHDLNRGLIERNAALVEAEHDRRHWRHYAEQGQWASLQSQVQAFQSQLQETRQGMVNFGTMAGVGQTSTSNNVR